MALCLLLVVADFGTAQQPGAERATVVLTAANLSRGGAQDQYRRIITEALTAEARSAGFRVLGPEAWEQARARLGIPPEDLVLGPNAVAVARAADAEVAATGSYRIDDNRIVVEIKFYDVKQERLVASGVRSGRTGLAVYNLVNQAVLDAVAALSPPAPTPVPAELASRVHEVAFVSADEGAELLVRGRTIATVSAGRAVVSSATDDQRLTVETRKQGFQPRSQRVRVKGGEAALQPLWPETRWAAEMTYTIGQLAGAGFGVRYYLQPDRLFLSGDDYFYVQSTFTPASSPVFHNDVRLLVGRYLFLGPYSAVRLGYAAGVGGIVTVFSNPDAGSGFDPYVSPGNLWIEWNTRRFLVYLRFEGKYATGGTSTGLLERGWMQIDQEGPPTSLGVVYKW